MVTKISAFVFETADPGIVKAQLIANGAFTEFNLLKTRKASFSEITKEIKFFSILVLTPHPLWITKGRSIVTKTFVHLSEMSLKTLLVQSQFKFSKQMIVFLKKQTGYK